MKLAKQSGITLIELLISLSIMAIVLCFSLPFAQTWYKKNQSQVLANEIMGAIQFSKAQAMINAEPLLLTHLPHSTNWSDGMLLCIDNAKHHYTPSSKILHEWHWQSPGVQLSWQGFQSKDYLLFDADINRSATNGFFLIENKTEYAIKLIVNRLGRVRYENSCAQGIYS